MPRRTLTRDALLVLLAIAAWSLEPSHRGASGAAAWVLTTTAGLLTVVVAFLLHEWGHLLGSLATGSRVFYPNTFTTPLLFHFDSATNDRRQFLWMSYGGYLASLVALAAILLFVPLDAWSGRVAIVLTAIGLAVTFVAEVPTTLRVLRGAALPSGYAFTQTSSEERRSPHP